MKTKNNVQKAILKSLAVVISIVLVSFTVSAQDFWESLLENNSFNEIALAMVESSSESINVSADANNSIDAYALMSILEEETEEALELEDWMTSESSFIETFTIEEASENPLEIENWMKNEAYFSAPAMYLEVASEEVLEIEEWMMKTESFTVENENVEFEVAEKYITGRNFIFVSVAEVELELENWMINDKIWNK